MTEPDLAATANDAPEVADDAHDERLDLWPVRDGDGAQQVVKAVHSRLRNAILTGDLPAGQIISQVKLSAELGVSRTPLREALRLLEREGFVELEHNKRMRIAPYSVDELEQVYAMRITLEALAVRISVPFLTSEDIEFVDEVHEKMRFYAVREDYASWEEPHREFHGRLLIRSGDTLRRTLDQLSDHAERYRHAASTRSPLAWENGLIEHKAILDRARLRDGAGVAEALGRHYARVALNAVTLAAPEHDPRQIREALRAVIAANSRPS
jgi:DNA-binding GntR family transcriptional regulator